MFPEYTKLKFQPGDRVVAVETFDEIKVGDTGTFVHEDKDSWPELGVRWDKDLEDGHDCAGHCEYGYGWYVPIGYLDFAESVDFGELPEVDHGAESILFGL